MRVAVVVMNERVKKKKNVYSTSFFEIRLIFEETERLKDLHFYATTLMFIYYYY